MRILPVLVATFLPLAGHAESLARTHVSVSAGIGLELAAEACADWFPLRYLGVSGGVGGYRSYPHVREETVHVAREAAFGVSLRSSRIDLEKGKGLVLLLSMQAVRIEIFDQPRNTYRDEASGMRGGITLEFDLWKHGGLRFNNRWTTFRPHRGARRSFESQTFGVFARF